MTFEPSYRQSSHQIISYCSSIAMLHDSVDIEKEKNQKKSHLLIQVT